MSDAAPPLTAEALLAGLPIYAFDHFEPLPAPSGHERLALERRKPQTLRAFGLTPKELSAWGDLYKRAAGQRQDQRSAVRPRTSDPYPIP